MIKKLSSINSTTINSLLKQASKFAKTTIRSLTDKTRSPELYAKLKQRFMLRLMNLHERCLNCILNTFEHLTILSTKDIITRVA